MVFLCVKYITMTKSIRNRKSQRKNSRGRTKRITHGGCGCNNTVPMSGGNGLAELSKDLYYPLAHDNQLQQTNLSSRNITGGRRRKPSSLRKSKRSKRNKHRKMSGGNPLGFDAVTSSGNTAAVSGALGILTNVSSVNTALNAQPTVHTYGIHSPPMV